MKTRNGLVTAERLAEPGEHQRIETGRQLMQLAHVIVRLEDQRHGRELKLSYRQMRILKHVYAGVTSATELGKIFGVTPPAISETLEALVRKKLLTREPHESDRRSVRLQITEEGARMHLAAQAAEDELACEVLSPLTAAQVETLRALVSKVLPPSQESLLKRRRTVR